MVHICVVNNYLDVWKHVFPDTHLIGTSDCQDGNNTFVLRKL